MSSSVQVQLLVAFSYWTQNSLSKNQFKDLNVVVVVVVAVTSILIDFVQLTQ